MYIHVYEYHGIMLIPTVAKTDAGFYIEIEPVAVPEPTVSNIASALTAAKQRSSTVIPAPRRGEYSKPVVLRHAKARSWKDFERGARLWKVTWSNGTFRLRRTAHVDADQGWRETNSFEFTTLVDVARALVDELSATPGS